VSVGIVPTYGDKLAFSGTFVLVAGRNSNANNIYLRTEGNVATNSSSYLLPFDCTLRAISASSTAAETWTPEIRVGGVVQASFSIVAAANGYDNSFNLNFNQGDAIQFFCNGSGVSNPTMAAYFVRRE
jgi:hypothetical protein